MFYSVKTFLPNYLRQTEEIAKDRLLADRDLEDVSVIDDTLGITKTQLPMSKAMAKCGIQVVQDETFFVEPKSEEGA